MLNVAEIRPLKKPRTLKQLQYCAKLSGHALVIFLEPQTLNLIDCVIMLK